MHSRLTRWSRFVLLAGIVLALVLVIPAAWFPFQLAKVAVFAALLAISAVLFVAGGGARDLYRTHGFFGALLVGLLPLVYLISALLSPDRSLSLMGYGVETDTVLFVTIAALAYLLSFTLFRTLRTARLLVTVVFWSLTAAAVFQLISVLFGTTVIPLSAFADRSVNLIGKWNDLGLLCGLLFVLLLARTEAGPASRLWHIATAVGGVLLIVLLALVNFAFAWVLLFCGCAVVGLLAFLRHRADGEQHTTGSITRWYPAAGAALAVVFLLYGTAINVSLTSVFPVSSLEVRPGFASTLDVVQKARTGVSDILVGTGPNTFGVSWLASKPTDVNKTPFWNLDFNVGFSTVATAFGTTGILGVLAWLVPLGLLILGLVRAVRLRVLSREERATATVLGLGSLYLLSTLIFYVPSQNIVLLTFVLSGAAFGFLWRQGRSAEEGAPSSNTFGALALHGLAAALVVLVVVTSFATVRRMVAQAYVGLGLYAVSKGSVDEALSYAERSYQIEPTADALRLGTDVGLQKLAAIAQDTSLAPEQARDVFTAQVQATIPAGQAAIAAAPLDYRGYFSLGRVYDLLASLKVDGAYQGAQAAYAAAAERNPSSPVIPLAVARLEAAQGNLKSTEEALTKALQLKADYTDAILFVVQLNIANNDLSSALRNTQIAVQTAPGVASIWFQLGLLYYAGGDTKNAIAPLEEAIRLVSNYANAKYFLGLAYYGQGRQNDSLRVFEELAVSNPENEEVKVILSNLRSGKEPLEGLQAPAPEDRDTAPVRQ